MNKVKAKYYSRLIIVTCTTALVVGCVSNPVKSRDGELDPNYTDARERVEVPSFQPDPGSGAPETPASPPVPKSEKFAGTGNFIDKEAARSKPAEVVVEDGKIRFNFEALPVQDLIRAVLGEMLGENYVIAPGVDGEVTFATAKPINREQIMPILEMLLRWNNATMVYRDGQYQILPVQQAIPGNLSPRLARAASVQGFEVLAVPLEYVSPTQMQVILEPYIREGAIINVDNDRSLMVLAGTRAELENYLRTIDIFDVDWLEGMSVGIFRLDLVEAKDVTIELESVFGESAETPVAGMFRFIPIEHLNAIMVITPQQKYLDQAETWIQRLDRGEVGAANRLYVYRVENLEAGALADYLLDIFGGKRSARKAGGNRNELTAGSIGPGLEPVSLSSLNEQAENELREEQEDSTVVAEKTKPKGTPIGNSDNVRITAVEETNSLLIQATPSQYGNILGAIKNLDTEPLQVLVEVHVIQVTLNEALSYGVNYFLSNYYPNVADAGSDSGDNGAGGGNTVEVGRTKATSLNAPGFISQSGSFTGDNALLTLVSNPMSRFGDFFRATINALETVSDARTISSPTLLVRNNTESSINVGEQLAIANTTFNNLQGSDAGTTSSTQFVQTGTTLTITPRVNPGGLVYVELTQEVSAPSGTTGPNDNPNISTNTLNTNVAVRSGQSIILGGLIRDTVSDSESGIPLLRRIPWLGRMFENSTLNSDRTEIVIILKPTVIESIDKLQKVADEFSHKFRGLEPIERPVMMPNENMPRNVDVPGTME